MKKILTYEELKYRAREGDGICSLCNEWSFGNADPMAENVYCMACDNRTVYGVTVAKSLELIEVRA